MYFRRILAEGQFLLCPLSNVRVFTKTVRGISFGVNFKSLNPKSFLFLPPYLLFLKLLSCLRRKCVWVERGTEERRLSNTFRWRCFLPSFHSALHFFDRSLDLLAQPTAPRYQQQSRYGMKKLETVKVLGPSKAWVNTKRSMYKEWSLKRFR